MRGSSSASVRWSTKLAKVSVDVVTRRYSTLPRLPVLIRLARSGPQPADARVEVAPVVAAHDRLDDLDPAVGAGQRVLERPQRVDLPVRGPGGGAQAADVDPV